MNPLQDDKAPYALALLLGAFGWHVSQITAEVKGSNTIAYTVTNDADKRQQTVRIDNLSDNNGIGELNFELICPRQSECLESVEQKAIGIFMIPVRICKEAVYSHVRISLPPQSSVNIISNVKPSQPFPQLHYNPTTRNRCMDDQSILIATEYELTEPVVMLDGNSWRVFLTKNYMVLILMSFSLVLLILLSVIASFLLSRRPIAGELPASADGRRKRTKRGPSRA